MNKQENGRLIILETKVDNICENTRYIMDNMVSRGTVNILKWATGIIGTVAISAIVIAAQ